MLQLLLLLSLLLLQLELLDCLLHSKLHCLLLLHLKIRERLLQIEILVIFMSSTLSSVDVDFVLVVPVPNVRVGSLLPGSSVGPSGFVSHLVDLLLELVSKSLLGGRGPAWSSKTNEKRLIQCSKERMKFLLTCG